MKVGIMQPYFMPYIGYFQLINCLDVFVIYDNIEYTKKGWINRNRILSNKTDYLLTLPLKKDSDFLNVNQRFLSDNWQKEKTKLLNIIQASYQKAPNFTEVFKLIQTCFLFESKNLFEFIYHSIKTICSYLDINTKIVVSSSLSINHQLKAEEKVLAICKTLQANQYINSIGGLQLYQQETFLEQNIQLNFIKTNHFTYSQFNHEFVPFLSIIDVLMFNSKSETKNFINNQFEMS